jgi:hypothetical protein
VSYRPITRAEAKTRVLALLREAEVAGDIDLLTDAIITTVLGRERKPPVPAQSPCAGCGRTKVPLRAFHTDPAHRAAGRVPHGAGDLCSACYVRQRRGANGPADPGRDKRNKPKANAFPISPSLIAQLRAADPECSEAAG